MVHFRTPLRMVCERPFHPRNGRVGLCYRTPPGICPRSHAKGSRSLAETTRLPLSRPGQSLRPLALPLLASSLGPKPPLFARRLRPELSLPSPLGLVSCRRRRRIQRKAEGRDLEPASVSVASPPGAPLVQLEEEQPPPAVWTSRRCPAVRYRTLPAVLGPEQATAHGAPVLAHFGESPRPQLLRLGLPGRYGQGHPAPTLPPFPPQEVDALGERHPPPALRAEPLSEESQSPRVSTMRRLCISNVVRHPLHRCCRHVTHSVHLSLGALLSRVHRRLRNADSAPGSPSPGGRGGTRAAGVVRTNPRPAFVAITSWLPIRAERPTQHLPEVSCETPGVVPDTTVGRWHGGSRRSPPSAGVCLCDRSPVLPQRDGRGVLRFLLGIADLVC